MNPPVDGISQSCHALTRKICSISEPFRGQAVSVFYIFTCTWMGEERCTWQEVLQLHWISSCIFHRFNIASRIYRGKLATEVLPWRKGSPFSRKIIRCEGDESWNFRNEIGEISLRFSALETFNARKIWFRLPQRGNSGCFRIYDLMRFHWIKAVRVDFSHVYCPPCTRERSKCKMILVFLEILSLGIWVIGVLYYNIILESLSTIFIGKSFWAFDLMNSCIMQLLFQIF